MVHSVSVVNDNVKKSIKIRLDILVIEKI